MFLFEYNMNGELIMSFQFPPKDGVACKIILSFTDNMSE